MNRRLLTNNKTLLERLLRNGKSLALGLRYGSSSTAAALRTDNFIDGNSNGSGVVVGVTDNNGAGGGGGCGSLSPSSSRFSATATFNGEKGYYDLNDPNLLFAMSKELREYLNSNTGKGSKHFGNVHSVFRNILGELLENYDHSQHQGILRHQLSMCEAVAFEIWNRMAMHKISDSITMNDQTKVANLFLESYLKLGDWDRFNWWKLEVIENLRIQKDFATFVFSLKALLATISETDTLRLQISLTFREIIERFPGISMSLILNCNEFDEEEANFLADCLSLSYPHIHMEVFGKKAGMMNLKCIDTEIEFDEKEYESVPQLKEDLNSPIGIHYIRQCVQSLHDGATKSIYELQDNLEIATINAINEMNEAIFQRQMENEKMNDIRNVPMIFDYLLPKLEKKILEVMNRGNGNFLQRLPSVIPAYNLARLTFTACCAVDSKISQGIRTNMVVTNLGTAISHEIIYHKLLASHPKHSHKSMKKKLQSKRFLSQRFREEMTETSEFDNRNQTRLGKTELDGIAAELIGILLNNCSVPLHIVQGEKRNLSEDDSETGTKTETIAIFKNCLDKMKDYTYYRSIIFRHPLFHQQLTKCLEINPASLLAPILPMIVPSKPWIDSNNGGYYNIRQPLIREKDSDYYVSGRLVKDSIRKGEIESVLSALDELGSVAWRVNSPVLKTMIEAWNSNLEVGKLIRQPDETDPNNESMSENEKSRIHSIRSDLQYKLEIARSFVGRKIYFPHNLDFRGRCYSIPVHLNHMGHDVCRSLLVFDEEVELGERGLRWLLIHLANMYGKDKLSFDDRESFSLEHKDQILDSADNPLTGSKWWMEAENPWQTLACCQELANAWRHPDGPHYFKSRLPVQIDGSCNGLQHYAALGRDELGGRQVNLLPSDKPMDLYTAIANSVEEMVSADVEIIKSWETEHGTIESYQTHINGETNTHENSLKPITETFRIISSPDVTSEQYDKALGKSLEYPSESRMFLYVNKCGIFNAFAVKFTKGKVSRKVVKQTVMTTVYGVTKYGAKAQVLKKLEELYGGQSVVPSTGTPVSGEESIAEMNDEEETSLDEMEHETSLDEMEEETSLDEMEHETTLDELRQEQMSFKDDERRRIKSLLSWTASYISSVVFESLGVYFASAQKHQIWLGHASSEICSSIRLSDLDLSYGKNLKPWLTLLKRFDEQQCLGSFVKKEGKTDSNSLDQLKGSTTMPPNADNAENEITCVDQLLDDLSASKSTSTTTAVKGKPVVKGNSILFLCEGFPELRELYKKWIREGDCEEKNVKKSPFKGYLYPNEAMRWKTPLGIYVAQPYYVRKYRSLKTSMLTVNIRNSLSESVVNVVKQRSGMPPNYVHSLDATHMMMTCLDFINNVKVNSKDNENDNDHDDSSLSSSSSSLSSSKISSLSSSSSSTSSSFAHVHDCYWSHARNIDYLHIACRNAFIKLHEESLFGKLVEFLEDKNEGFGNNVVPKKIIAKKLENIISDLEKLSSELSSSSSLSSSNNIQIKREIVEKWISVLQNAFKKKGRSTYAKALIFRPITFLPLPKKGTLDLSKHRYTFKSIMKEPPTMLYGMARSFGLFSLFYFTEQNLFGLHRVLGNSMNDTLHNGDWILVIRPALFRFLAYSQEWIREVKLSLQEKPLTLYPKSSLECFVSDLAGRIVIIKNPESSSHSHSHSHADSYLTDSRRKYLIKRCVGIPQQRVWIGNSHVKSSDTFYSSYPTSNWQDWYSFQSNDIDSERDVIDDIDSGKWIILPKGRIWLEGDNKEPGESRDSKSFGPVPIAMTMGIAIASCSKSFNKINFH